MSALGHYIQIHLAGAAAGIDLFRISGRRLTDPGSRDVVQAIAVELVDERLRLVKMAESVGAHDPRLLSLATRAGAQATRLGPNGNWLRQNAATDLSVLEAMRDAVAGKIAGWEALLTVVVEQPSLNREELDSLLAQAQRQHDELCAAHSSAARRALSS